MLEGTERVLDLGCGDGRVTAELARRVPEGSVLGLDASESMIASCVQDHTHTEGLRFEVAHATDFSVAEPFHVAVSFSALHWVEDLDGDLSCLGRALLHATGLEGEEALQFCREIVDNLRASSPAGSGPVMRTTLLIARAVRSG